ncbi:hypothetical protein V8E55_006636 [Tylopilus felleus]
MNKRTSCESPRDPGGETEVDRNGSVAHEVGMQESTGTSGEYPKMSRMMRARVDVSKCVARGKCSARSKNLSPGPYYYIELEGEEEAGASRDEIFRDGNTDISGASTNNEGAEEVAKRLRTQTSARGVRGGAPIWRRSRRAGTRATAPGDVHDDFACSWIDMGEHVDGMNALCRDAGSGGQEGEELGVSTAKPLKANEGRTAQQAAFVASQNDSHEQCKHTSNDIPPSTTRTLRDVEVESKRDLEKSAEPERGLGGGLRVTRSGDRIRTKLDESKASHTHKRYRRSASHTQDACASLREVAETEDDNSPRT